jgi:hypothetical protein
MASHLQLCPQIGLDYQKVKKKQYHDQLSSKRLKQMVQKKRQKALAIKYFYQHENQ